MNCRRDRRGDFIICPMLCNSNGTDKYAVATFTLRRNNSLLATFTAMGLDILRNRILTMVRDCGHGGYIFIMEYRTSSTYKRKVI